MYFQYEYIYKANCIIDIGSFFKTFLLFYSYFIISL